MQNKSIIFGLVLVALSLISLSISSNFEKPKTNIPEAESSGMVVLELYTSQGCSSCPSADILLEKVKNEYKEEVFALSYHVDYWNYIGWQDPFSKPVYTEKQTAYNYKFRNRSNYTPQLVVNGQAHFVGSSTAKMAENIRLFKQKSVENKMVISNIDYNEAKINFDYAILGSLQNKQVRVILVIDKRVTKVNKGENNNRTLTNTNIVVQEKVITAAASGKNFISIPKIVEPNDAISLVLLTESDNFDITGAAKSPIKR